MASQESSKVFHVNIFLESLAHMFSNFPYSGKFNFYQFVRPVLTRPGSQILTVDKIMTNRGDSELHFLVNFES